MADSVNDQLADAAIQHAVDLQRLSADQVAKVIDQLDDLATEVAAKLRKGGQTAFQQQRAKALLAQLAGTVDERYQGIAAQHVRDLAKLAGVESSFARASLDQAIGVPVATTALSEHQLAAVADDALIEGRRVKEWWSAQGESYKGVLRREITNGYLSGEGVDKITQRLLGSKDTPGAFVGPRHQAEALVRTSIQQVASDARLASYRQNSDIIKYIQHHSTLDTRTSEICKARDGLLYTLDGEPVGHDKPFQSGIPYHWNCRSTWVSVLKSWDELAGPKALPPERGKQEVPFEELFTKRLQSRGWSAAKIADAKANARSSLDGAVPSTLDFDSWLTLKEAQEPGWAVRNGVLTAAKHRLWSAGKIKMADLIDQTGNELSIEQLEELVTKGSTAALKEAEIKGWEAAVQQAEKRRSALNTAESAAREAITAAGMGGPVRGLLNRVVREARSGRPMPDDISLSNLPDAVKAAFADAIGAARAVFEAEQAAGPARSLLKERVLKEAARTHPKLKDPNGHVVFRPGGATDISPPKGPKLAPAERPEDWDKVTGTKRIAGERIPTLGLDQSAGVLVVEDDGRVWMVRAHLDQDGGHLQPASTFYGRTEAATPVLLQREAIRAAYDQLGLAVKIEGIAGDVIDGTTWRRIYLARRTGGAPWDASLGVDGVELLPAERAMEAMRLGADKQTMAAALGRLAEARALGNGDLWKGFAALAKTGGTAAAAGGGVAWGGPPSDLRDTYVGRITIEDKLKRDPDGKKTAEVIATWYRDVVPEKDLWAVQVHKPLSKNEVGTPFTFTSGPSAGKQAAGHHDSNLREIILQPKLSSPLNVQAHEFGHALDDALGARLGQSYRSFQHRVDGMRLHELMAEEALALPEQERAAFLERSKYWLLNPLEVFAELYSTFRSPVGRWAYQYDRHWMQRRFARTISAVSDILQDADLDRLA